jgi:hypothetical protein
VRVKPIIKTTELIRKNNFWNPKKWLRVEYIG